MDDDLEEFKKNVIGTLQKSQDDFEKQLSFISAGALGLSMLLIDKVVKDINGAQDKWILISSWSFLGATLIINLLSHFLSVLFNYKSIQEIDTELFDTDVINKRNNSLKWINLSTLVTLLIGIVCLIIFISINI